jgi:hypothetical protein
MTGPKSGKGWAQAVEGRAGDGGAGRLHGVCGAGQLQRRTASWRAAATQAPAGAMSVFVEGERLRGVFFCVSPLTLMGFLRLAGPAHWG